MQNLKLFVVAGLLALGCESAEGGASPDAGPSGGAPAGGEPVGGAPVGGQPVGGAPVGGQPVGGAPVGGQPVGGAPVGGQPVGGASPPVDVCTLAPEFGDCDAAFQRWYFDPASGECAEFTYGGCGGNGNNFETRDACLAACGAVVPPPLPPCGDADADGTCDDADAECNLDGNPALCDIVPPQCPAGTVPEVVGGCYTFACVTWAQCGGAPPPVEVCTLAPEFGDCDAAFQRWYFDPASGECAEFTYGGCGGNGNNFETRDACLAACGAVVPPPPPPCGDADADGTCDDFDGECNADGSELLCRRVAPQCPPGTVPEIRNSCYTDACLDWSACAAASAPVIPCGGFAGFVCPDALVCEDDPTDDCDPKAGGADCPGRCVSPR